MDIHANSSRILSVRHLTDINSPPHIHDDDEIEIMIMLEGNASCTVNGTSYALNDNTFVIITEYQTHSYFNTDAVNTVSFIFTKQFNERLYRFFCDHIFNPPIIDIPADLEELKPIFKLLISELDSEKHQDDLIYESYANIVLAKLINIINTDIEVNNRKKVLKNSVLIDAQDYCRANHTKPLTVNDIAKELGVHPNYLSSSFIKHFGISVIYYLNVCRLRHAISLMGKKNLSITEIAFASGFQSVRTFNRIFKSEMGESPKEFQKALLSSPKNTYTNI